MPYFFVTRRISHQRCSIKGVLRNFVNFTVKHLCQSLFLNTRPEACNFIKKTLRCFPVNFAKFLQKHLRATTAMPIYLLQNLQGHLSVGQSVFFFEKYLMTFRFQFHKGLILIFLGQKKIWFLF